jgi:dipeptidyl aminopeptidase/acylaminoacyl peptidase
MLIPIVVAIAVAAAFVWHVTRSHYRAVMNEFEPWRNAELLNHPESAGAPNLQEVTFESLDKIRLTGWYVPSRNHAAVVLTHGTNADRTTMLPELRILSERGFGVLALDWPGYGNSGGEIRYDYRERDALVAAIDWLVTQESVDPGRIGVFGFSIGAYLTAQVASYDVRLRAVVLAGPPPNFARYIERSHSTWGPLSRWAARLALQRSGMPLSELVPEDVIGSISPRPILFLSGTADTNVRADIVRALYDRARDPKELWIVPGAGHGNYAQVAGQQYARRLGDFFAEHLLN